MENQRLIIFISLCFVSLLLYQNWQRDYGPQSQQQTPVAGQAGANTQAADVPGVKHDAAGVDGTAASASLAPSAGKITVRTDVLALQIDRKGGDIRQAALPQFPVALDKPDEPLVLMDDQGASFFVAQSGLLSKSEAPNHDAVYRSSADSYVMEEGDDTLVVTLSWSGESGVEVRKIYTFERGSYLVQLGYEIVNKTTDNWSGRPYGQLQRAAENGRSGFVYTYIGAAISSPEKRYEKIDFASMDDEKLDRDITGGWAAILQHYFLAAFVPDARETYHYYTLSPGNNRYIIGLYGPAMDIAPGESRSTSMSLYAGPKNQHRLEQIAPGLELTVDYGVLWFLAKPLFWLLELFHELVGNWGWSVILVTITIKLLFFQLSAKSYKSMANMRRVQPKMVAIKERCGDDKAKLNQEMMELYKKEKINPLGGCLPILIQIPVFIALYWVLLESVELRQAPWVLWIKDLSTADPYFVLPVLMGISMFVQQKLNPAPVDPIQAKVMTALPLVFSVFFAFFPSGLVLYWVVNNVLSIAQQWVITNKLESSGA